MGIRAPFALALGSLSGAVAGRRASGPTLVAWPEKIRDVFPLAVGGLIGAKTAGVIALALYGKRIRISPALAGTLVVGAGAGAIGAKAAADRVLASLAQNGRELDPGYQTPPRSPFVSGGPGSHVEYASMGREGARFVSATQSPADIAKVSGKTPTADPIRVFVGLENAPTIESRVALAMSELHRTGAFDRDILVVQAPAGTGFANATPIDVVEILSGGNCASVVIGYGLLPSFLSLGKVQVAGETQRQLLDAIAAELATRAKKPRVFLYGESLGAKVQQWAVPNGSPDLDRYYVDAALYVGTPGGTHSDAFHANVSAESFTLDRPEQIPDAQYRVWFLEHDGDPVVRFRPDLIWAEPSWLVAEPRGRNVPESMEWTPLITWMQVLVDTLFATNVKPGDFQSMGHDYRADLGAVTTAAFRFEVTPDVAARLEEHLRAEEVQKAHIIEGTT